MREKNQVVLPLDLGIRIPEGDFVFKVAEICESLDYTELFKIYIRFMWLLNGEPAPSDSTITRFQRDHLAEVIEDLFYQFIEKLYEMGEVKFKNLFIDGTKIEAYANKSCFCAEY